MRPLHLCFVLLTLPSLGGCVVVAAADAVGTVAATGVKMGAKTASVAGGVAIGTVDAAGHLIVGRSDHAR